MERADVRAEQHPFPRIHEQGDPVGHIAAEKESAINDIRRQVAILSVDVAEKVLRKKLSDDKEQLELVNRLLDEVKSNNNIE